MRNKLGKIFEDDMESTFRAIFKQEVRRVTDSAADLKAGTDFFIEGVPVDISLNSDKLKSIEVLYSNEDLFTTTIIGIRTDNGHGELKAPVLVIGMYSDLIMSEYYYENYEKLFNDLKELCPNGFEPLKKLYLDWCKTNFDTVKYAKKLYKVILKKMLDGKSFEDISKSVKKYWPECQYFLNLQQLKRLYLMAAASVSLKAKATV